MAVVSGNYSHEFRSPPVPLVALMGCPDAHKMAADYFLHSLKPPLVSLCCNEPVEQFVPRVFGTVIRPSAASSPKLSQLGIFKADWLTKHRQIRPAVAVAFVTRQDLDADPNVWNQMLYQLKVMRDAALPRGAGMVVAVVQSSSAGDLPHEAATAICHHLALDPRALVTVCQQAPPGVVEEESVSLQREAALRSLGTLISDQCAAYYARRAKHVGDKLATRQLSAPSERVPLELSARAAIKVAVFAELRQDWREAVRHYQSAYAVVRALVHGGVNSPPAVISSVPSRLMASALSSSFSMSQLTGAIEGPLGAGAAAGSPRHAYHSSLGGAAAGSTGGGQPSSPRAAPLSPQRFAQAARVAELLQLKLIILLTYRERLEEAVAQTNAHLQLYIKPPVQLPLAAAAAHAGYVIRQLQVAAEVLSPRLEGSALAAAAKECGRVSLLMTAAQVAVDRRRMVDGLKAARATSAQPALYQCIDLGAVKKGPWVGSVALRTQTGTRELTDAEYLLWVEAEEVRLPVGATATSASQATAASTGLATGLAGASASAIDVINAALQALRDSRLERARARLGALLAEEYWALGSTSAARKLLLQVAHTYRRDGWELPLARVVLLLRDVAQRLRMPLEHLTYSLELAALLAALPPHALQALSASAPPGLSVPDPVALVNSSVAALVSGTPDVARLPGIIKPSRDGTSESVATTSSSSQLSQQPRNLSYTVEWLDMATAAARRTAEPDARPFTVADLLQRHCQQDFGWWRCLGCAVAFAAGAPPDAQSLDLFVSLRNNLGCSLPITSVSFTLADEQAGQWVVPAMAVPLPVELPPFQPPSPDAAANTHSQSPDPKSQQGNGPGPGPGPGYSVQSTGASDTSSMSQAPQGPHISALEARHPLSLSLQPGTWAQLATRVAPRSVGRLRVERVQVGIGHHACVSLVASSFPPGPYASLGGLVERTAGLEAGRGPWAGLPAVVVGAPWAAIQHVGPLPSLHLQSQQQGGPALVGEPFFMSAHIQVAHLLPSSVLELAVRPMASGLTPADITVIVDDRGALERYHGHDVARLQLPAIPAGSTHLARLWVLTRKPGRVALAVTLQCPALVHQVKEFEVEEPWDLSVHLTAEPGHHVLVPPVPGHGSQGQGQVQPLAVGQPALAHCAVRHVDLDSQQSTTLELVTAQLVADPGSGCACLSELQSQVVGSEGEALHRLGRGDVALLLASLLPATLTPPGVALPLGRLHLTWRRVELPLGSDSPPLHALQQGAPQQNGEVPETPGQLSLSLVRWAQLQRQQPRPDPKVATSLALPAVIVREGLLSARTLAPPQATAGIAFSFTLQVQSFSDSVEELSLIVLDTPGFVVSGERAQQVSLPPRSSAMAVTWLLVAHAAGQLVLPSIRLAATKHSATLTTQPGTVSVLPF